MSQTQFPITQGNVRESEQVSTEAMDQSAENQEGPNKKARNSFDQSAHQTPVITSPTTRKTTSNSQVVDSPTRSYRRGQSGASDSENDNSSVFSRGRYDPARDTENRSMHAANDWPDQQNFTAQPAPPPESTASPSEDMDDEDETAKLFGPGKAHPYRRSGSSVTPRKPNNRVSHASVGTIPALILQWPSKDVERANLPPNKDLNPHGPLLPSDQDADVQIHFQKASVSDGTWESVVFYPSDLLLNLEPEQRKAVTESPEKWLAVVYLNGGQDLFRKRTSTVIDTKSFLNEVGCQVEVVIAPFYETNAPLSPAPKRPRGQRDNRKPARKPIAEGEGDKYAGGYTAFFKVTDPAMRGYLTERQTWAISPVLAFHVLEFDAMERPWTVCLVYANIDSTSIETGEDILYAIKNTLWHDTKFTTLYMNNTSYTGSQQEAVLAFTNTFELVYSGYNVTYKGNSPQVWVLYAEPFATGKDFWEMDEAEKAVRTYISKKEFFIDGAKIVCERRTCVTCKATTHHSEECRFRKANGWNGPTMGVNQTIEALAKKSAEEKQSPGPSRRRR
ncbi:hypothetical protein EV361DRAFT_955462 [Lentinula raphanica]|uniref:Uncharacterized protein n=1 Tax=Lentinula raphanica TaxID=153919 RepID=A0AA38UE17_9AGAR|nr:hypothetical protein F5878DRAFT_661600 [Lentinula raphanica]KAJ3964962.1 hypothetical protein EV361DRAFT_955462 [Lentinula raphanica]